MDAAVASSLCDLINAHLGLAEPYTPQMVSDHAKQYIVRTEPDSPTQVVGLVCVKRLAWHLAEIGKLVVVPGRRRKGMGRSLLLAGESRCRNTGARVALLTVRVGNVPMEKLAAREGYVAGVEFVNHGTGNAVRTYLKVL